LGIERVRTINEEAVKSCVPEYILFMDLDVELGLSRTFDAHGDKRERKTLDFFQQVYA
jgi:thymidylate kinase